ncbi:hypothetical protein ACFY9A_19310 [Streptomyces rubradiris]|uniref:hypothetical protein n=1 Tax=Streptomyces rubradiris TaxID=285531 RepID=UPI0036EDDA95
MPLVFPCGRPGGSRERLLGLGRVHAGDPAAYGGSRLARTVLGLATDDAEAGVSLARRTRAFRRPTAVDAPPHDRLTAAPSPPSPRTLGRPDPPAPAGAGDAND